mmetsp:Transcript_14765/g.27783  ORF Transcript_14765/g.27783 Transcript_14765/m.27783 type:complete len:260 (-) Transcript_14765:376-1155(-)
MPMKPLGHNIIPTLCFLYLSTYQLCSGAFVPHNHGVIPSSTSFFLRQEAANHNLLTLDSSTTSIPLHRKSEATATAKTQTSLFSFHEQAPEMSSRMTRRSAFHKALSVMVSASSIGCTALLGSSPAHAKDKTPVTKETVTASFQAVRDELEGSDGGINMLEGLIANEDFAGLMEFTKGYDLEFRKAKMGKARKFLTSKEDKDRAVSLCNAVTFDLIGMNKGSREGQQNINQVKKYYEELKADISLFLELEKGIDYSMYP